MVPAQVNQRYTIRFALAAPNACDEDIGKLVTYILHHAILSRSKLEQSYISLLERDHLREKWSHVIEF